MRLRALREWAKYTLAATKDGNLYAHCEEEYTDDFHDR